MRGMCLNWKVVAGLGAAAAVAFLFSPRLALSVLPFLAIAACPLSTLFMMRGMGNTSYRQTPDAAADRSAAKTTRPGIIQEDRIAQLGAEITRLRRENISSADISGKEGWTGVGCEPGVKV